MKTKMFVSVAALAAFMGTAGRAGRVMEPVDTSRLDVGGVLGEALEANVNGRLKQFIKDVNSPAIRLFDRAAAAKEMDKNWRGEHAGKWLHTAARAAHRTGDAELTASVQAVADYLVSQQEADGYLGTYAPSIRMTAESDINIKSWDIWVHAYLMLGLVEVNRYFPDERYIDCAKRIADLCIRTFQEGGRSIAHCSYHHGMVGTGTIDAAMELYAATGEKEYLDFAEYCAGQMEYRKGLELISRSLKGYDAALIGNGKNYEMIRNYVGLAKLAGVTGNSEYMQACLNGWGDIREHHLMPTGGPWGGIGVHPECFNVYFCFSPYGFNETCTTMVWTRLTGELLKSSGRAEYAEMLERVAYNAILGAQFPDGLGWCYHSHVNGKRSRTGEWACCSSSGAMALEQLPPVIYTTTEKGIAVNIYTPSRVTVDVPEVGPVTIEQQTKYPFDGDIEITVSCANNSRFDLLLRGFSWADGVSVVVNDKEAAAAKGTGGYMVVSGDWMNGDRVRVSVGMGPRLIRVWNAYNEKGWYMDGTSGYAALMRGPLVYAAEHADTLEAPDPIFVPKSISAGDFTSSAASSGLKGPTYSLAALGREPIIFVPFYEAGGRSNDICRVTWLQLK
jgi:DUF1680 family protein